MRKLLLSGFLKPSDLQGLAQLATDGVLGVAGMAESLHGTVLKTVALPFGPLGRWVADTSPGGSGVWLGSITGRVYGGVRGVTRLAGSGAGLLLAGAAAPLLAWRQRRGLPGHEGAHGLSGEAAPARESFREAFVSALNGVLGDHLAQTGNPLAIAMAFRVNGQSLTLGPSLADNQQALARLLPNANGKILLLVHGLCMNDLQWAGVHGKALARKRGYTPILLHYNTGLAIANNGRQLSALLEQLVQAWPQPIDSLAIVAHSMGGLVARSSCHAADYAQTPLRWRSVLQNLVFLGTPHQGAPLEQLGRWVDGTLGAFRFTRPFARIGKIRSRGIGDLRDGRISGDGQRNQALPAGVVCFAIAASLSSDAGISSASAGLLQQAHDQLLGDGLVPVDSALASNSLAFALDNTAVVPDCGHLALLDHPAVTAQLLRWL